jgi:dCMP deaminase
MLMRIAWAHSSMSHDPSTKVGAVIASEGKIVSWGYNHVPDRIPHTIEMLKNREWKYPRVIHAEQHALSNFDSSNFKNAVMYVTHHPCERCAAQIIHAGITQVFTHKVAPDMITRWPGMITAADMFSEAEVSVNFLEN